MSRVQDSEVRVQERQSTAVDCRRSPSIAVGSLSAIALVLLLAAGVLHAGEMRCEGVIGNSGEQGKDLVQYGTQPERGIGVAFDRFGGLWDRAGKGVLNRYAVDGRLLGQYPISTEADGSDKLSLAGDTLVLCLRRKLYRLDITAKPGTAPGAIGIEAKAISFGSVKERIAVIDSSDSLFLLAPKSGDRQQVLKLELKDIQDVELGPDGTIYVQAAWKMHRVVSGRLDEDWVRGAPGERPQLLDGFWFGHAWHGTIKRFNESLEAAPGVVLGGASGSFIGHLPQNSELVNGRGMAKVATNLYAVSGIGGVMHLIEWRTDTQKLEIIRRIGALPIVNGIGLDQKGRVWAIAGSWEWNAAPDTPMDLGVNGPEHPGVGQAVMLDNDVMVAPGFLWGKPSFYAGRFDKEVNAWRIDNGCSLRKNPVGSAVCRMNNKLALLVVDSKGKAQAFYIGSDGRYQGEAGEVELKTSQSAGAWTSLAMKDDNTLLAGAAGAVIEFKRDGNNWREASRWNSWGTGADRKFGSAICLAVDDAHLWIADTARHRVLCFDVKSKTVLGEFGDCDREGTSLKLLKSPRTIIGRGKRAVVFDSGNQRLLKLELE